ncbi:MAG: DNA gyrase subunit A [Chitinivibrionales bacterium]|nr:DNA gyrase subunit A [Chitinivibrionales bacterium]
MPDGEKQIPVFIEDEMQKSYLDYSMSMITARALPDVRDGLKPVHRRVMYGMEDLSLQHNKSHKKCARVVGDVIGKYHPHGDAAVYDTLVRMAQNFSLRYPMVDGQGNFGSVDGDPPAAMRYTECRMTRVAEEMLADIEKETVDFAPNYDDSTKEPSVLPAKIPFLLVNGATGIAVGMATNMAPHNLSEVIDAVIATIEDPEIDLPGLLKHIPGPDFPTGGVIYGRDGIVEAYRNGKGKVTVRAQTEIEKTSGDREQIIVTEIPYMVNKSTLLEKMGDLVRQKTIEGISFFRDESDRRGLRIVIGIKKDNYAEVVLNKLFKFTNLQVTFGINNLALVNMKPRLLSLKELIEQFVLHRVDVVVRRTTFELRKAKERAHILEGLKIAVDNIDEIVQLIKTSSSPEEAKQRLIDRFSLSEIQAKAILDMRLHRLTALERDKLEAEYNELMARIRELTEILESKDRQMQIIKDELMDIKNRFGDPRRTEIIDAGGEVEIEDMIADDFMVITMSHSGYIKRCPVSTYRAQARGGRGIKGMESKEDDYIENLFIASNHTYILFFTTMGRCYWLKVFRIPEAPRYGRGRPIVNLIQLRPEEKIAALVPTKEFDETSYLLMATEKGVVNKQPLKAYSNIRRDGINAIKLDPQDKLIECKLTNGNNDVILGTRNGQAVRFHESATRELGRNTRGMKGISLRGDDKVVAMIIIEESDLVLTVTENGYGKRTSVSDYRKTNRGGSGIINIKCTERNGKVVALKGIRDDCDMMLITRNGILIRMDVGKISVIGRNTQGVRLINLSKGDFVVSLALCDKETNGDENEEPVEAVEAAEIEDVSDTESPDAESPDSGEEPPSE